jgi:predicted TIM-barrel fold metal-dependent hydrolase
MTSSPFRILDGDGHILEDVPAISARLPEAVSRAAIVKASGPYPQLDNLHTGSWIAPPGSFENPGGVTGWGDFLDSTGIAGSIVYPSAGLGFCRLTDPDLAISLARAYNDWLYETYTSVDPRISGVALIPMQDPKAAVEELRYAIKDLGMPCAMLPPNGLHSLLGSEEYWPIYEEADRLGCALGIHGGAHHDLGLNRQSVFAGTHALGHPFGVMVQLVDLLLNNVFDRFPNVRFGFMEAGLAWFLLVMERLPGSYGAFVPADPRGRYLKMDPADLRGYILSLVRDGRIAVGIEGDEPALGYVVNKYGSDGLVFSSDFPHEVNKDTIEHELDELYENDEIDDDAKTAILSSNAERFYNLQPTAV